jgi:hypothetical protein
MPDLPMQGIAHGRLCVGPNGFSQKRLFFGIPFVSAGMEYEQV